MLVVTHDFGIARRLADRTLVVEDGRIVERGDTTTLSGTRKRNRYGRSG
jgi:ABC-type glutathione transport system ATPase component